MMKLKLVFILALSINLGKTKNLLKSNIFYNEKYVDDDFNLNSTLSENQTLPWLVNNSNAPFCKAPSINEFPNDFVPFFKQYHYESLFVINYYCVFEIYNILRFEKKGLVIHSIILVYSLIALSIVCDDFFVESLDKISKGLYAFYIFYIMKYLLFDLKIMKLTTTK
jgi:hypothetical protein